MQKRDRKSEQSSQCFPGGPDSRQQTFLYSSETNSDLAGGQDDAGQPAKEPPAGEAGDGGEGRGGETHHHVGQGHVADKQVDPLKMDIKSKDTSNWSGVVNRTCVNAGVPERSKNIIV